MKKMQVENIVDSMTLAKDVCGPSGNILLKTGTKLTPSLGRRLKNWGIQFVNVQSDNDTAHAETPPRISKEEIQNNLGSRFSAVMGNVLMKKIFDAVLSYKIQKGAM
jgi:hypothetical protein